MEDGFWHRLTSVFGVGLEGGIAALLDLSLNRLREGKNR